MLLHSMSWLWRLYCVVLLSARGQCDCIPVPKELCQMQSCEDSLEVIKDKKDSGVLLHGCSESDCLPGPLVMKAGSSQSRQF